VFWGRSVIPSDTGMYYVLTELPQCSVLGKVCYYALVGFNVHVNTSPVGSVTFNVCNKVLVDTSSRKLVEAGRLFMIGGYRQKC
jgi:hypothetical protein